MVENDCTDSTLRDPIDPAYVESTLRCLRHSYLRNYIRIVKYAGWAYNNWRCRTYATRAQGVVKDVSH